MPAVTRRAMSTLSVLATVAVIATGVSGQIYIGTPPAQGAWGAQPSTQAGEWPHYNADLRGTRFSPLSQINADNFRTLKLAWRFKTDNLGPFPEFKLEGTPLMVKGVVYATGGSRRSVVALDAKTGKLVKQSRLAATNNYYASPVLAGGHVYLLNDEGKLTVVSDQGAWKVVHTADFGQPTYATPAAVDGQIYLRTATALYCFGP